MNDFSSIEGHNDIGPDEGTRRLICFVGHSEAFSKVAMRTIEHEIDGVHVINVPDFSVLYLVLDAAGGISPEPSLCMVISDLRNALNMLVAADKGRAMIPGCKLTIGYDDEPLAQAFFAKHSKALIARHINFLPMNLNVTAWLNLLKLIGSGTHYVPPEFFGAAKPAPESSPRIDFEDIKTSEAQPPKEIADQGLTARECEVLQHAAAGRSNKSIARRLEISEHTVKLHMHRVIGKLGVRNRTEAAVRYLHGLDG